MSIQNLKRLLSSKNIYIESNYTLNNRIVLLSLFTQNGENILLNTSSYRLEGDQTSIQIYNFTDIRVPESLSNPYTTIETEQNIDSILEMYQEIDTVTEDTNEISDEINYHIVQIERLKKLTLSSKYKVSIVSTNYIVLCDENNNLKSYITKKQSSQNTKNIFLYTTIENFYKDIEEDNLNIKSLYKSILSHIDRVCKTGVKNLDLLIKDINNIKSSSDILSRKIEKIDTLKSNIEKIKDTIDDISRKKNNIQKSGGNDTSVKGVFERNENEKKIEKLQSLYSKLQSLLQTNKNEYSSLLLSFESSIASSVSFLEVSLKNLKKI